MHWLGLSYTLPSASASSKRVAVWRRLRQLGAVSPTGSLYLLPLGDENAEAMDWLAQEIEDGGGEALVLRVDRLEGEAEAKLIELFRTSRDEEYRKIAAEAEEALEPAGRDGLKERLEKLRRRFGEASRIDFFQAPEGPRAAAALARIEAALGRGDGPARDVPAAKRERYQGRRWVTRPHPHVDRLACAWLIRRFIDPQASFKFVPAKGYRPRPGELRFDMFEAEFTHEGDHCTFEVLLQRSGLDEPALAAISEIVHDIDLKDGKFARAEAGGIAALIDGLARADISDHERIDRGGALFDNLYALFGSRRR
jgi:hypothetical protein